MLLHRYECSNCRLIWNSLSTFHTSPVLAGVGLCSEVVAGTATRESSARPPAARGGSSGRAMSEGASGRSSCVESADGSVWSRRAESADSSVWTRRSAPADDSVRSRRTESADDSSRSRRAESISPSRATASTADSGRSDRGRPLSAETGRPGTFRRHPAAGPPTDRRPALPRPAHGCRSESGFW